MAVSAVGHGEVDLLDAAPAERIPPLAQTAFPLIRLGNQGHAGAVCRRLRGRPVRPARPSPRRAASASPSSALLLEAACLGELGRSASSKRSSAAKWARMSGWTSARPSLDRFAVLVETALLRLLRQRRRRRNDSSRGTPCGCRPSGPEPLVLHRRDVFPVDDGQVFCSRRRPSMSASMA